MNSINRPIDVLLNTEVAKARPQDRSDYLTGSNKRENSFDSVLSVKQREVRNAKSEVHEKRSPERESKVDSPNNDRPEKRSETEQSGKTETDNGKGLPPEKVADKEGKEPDEVKTDVSVLQQNLENAEGAALWSETITIETDLAVVSDEANVEASEQADSTLLALDDAGEEQPAAPQLTINGLDVSSVKQAAPESLSGVFNARESEIQFKPGNMPNGDKLKSGIELNLRGDAKMDLSEMSQGKQFSLGQELKQWLSESKVGPEVNRPPAASVVNNSNPTVNTTAQRVDGLAQAVQGLASTRSAGVTLSVPVTVNSPNWGQAVAQRIAWLASNGIQSAELKLNPPELGPVEVKISVSSDQTNINFSSQHASIREALELSVHRLREMLESNGLNLADVNVSDQSLARDNKTDTDSAEQVNVAAHEGSEESESQATIVTESSSLVDFYA